MKQLIKDVTGLFTPPEGEQTQTDATTVNTESTNATDSQERRWKLVLKYRDDESLQIYTLSSRFTTDESELSKGRDLLKSIVKSTHEQLNATLDDDMFIIVDDALVIRKSQFVSLSLSSV